MAAGSCEPGRLAKLPTEVQTALVFSGGGAKGAWEAGVAAEVVAKGVPIKLVAGTSAGALNATLVRRAVEEAFEMGMTYQIQRDVELARLKYPGVEVQLLTPSAPLRLRPLEFDPQVLARALERGKSDALACLTRLGY